MAMIDVLNARKGQSAPASIWSGTLGRVPFALGFVGVLALAFVFFMAAQMVTEPALIIGVRLVGGLAFYILMASLVIRRARQAGQMWLAWLTLIPIPLPLIRWAFIAALLVWPEKKADQPMPVPMAAVA